MVPVVVTVIATVVVTVVVLFAGDSSLRFYVSFHRTLVVTPNLPTNIIPTNIA